MTASVSDIGEVAGPGQLRAASSCRPRRRARPRPGRAAGPAASGVTVVTLSLAPRPAARGPAGPARRASAWVGGLIPDRTKRLAVAAGDIRLGNDPAKISESSHKLMSSNLEGLGL